MPGSPTPPNLNTAPPSSAGAAQFIEAPPCDWTSTMTTATGPASAPVNAPTSSNKRRRDAMQQDIAGRDYYNNLKQSELIDLVVKLQEQNLILTRLLERSTLTAAATSSAPASSNARLNLTPNVNFTRTKSGSAASRYASETDFPTMNNNAGTKKGSAAATANTDNNATTTKKSSGSNKKASKKSSAKTKVPTDAAEAKKWALRLFTTPAAAADANDGDETQQSSSNSQQWVIFVTLCYTFAWTPASFCFGLIVPIFKKGVPNSAANYRPISLTNTFRKLYERCLKFCLLLHMPSLDVAQGGFRAARSGISQAWNLLALQQQFEQQYGVSPALIFMNISKAYDSVTRSRIWQLLHPHLPKTLFYTLRHLFDHVTLNVVINNATSLPNYPKRGLLQGSILSPFLYAIFINQLPALLRTAPVRFPLYVDAATRACTDGDGPSAVIAEPSLALVKYGEGPRLSEAASSCSSRLNVVRQRTVIHSLLYADDVCLIAHRYDIPLRPNR